MSELYQQHWVGLVRLAVLMVDDRQAAEDVVLVKDADGWTIHPA